MDEIERAELHEDLALPRGTVRMGSEVEFVDEQRGDSRRVRLVVPALADIESGRISIMTWIGAGLIGLTEGQVIEWPGADGQARRLRVEKVRD
jgi:regulator of nucleoside diphosphate kinase